MQGKYRTHSTLWFLSVAIFFFAHSFASAGMVVPRNVTDFFGNHGGAADAGDAAGLLFDEARTGGSDTSASSSIVIRRTLESNAGTNDNWATGLPTRTAGTITFTGLGFPLRGGTTATQINLSILYLGNDGVGGTFDDEVVGTVSDSLAFTSTAEYGWKFDAPLTFELDGTEAMYAFRFDLSTGGTGNLRFKSRSSNESPSGQSGVPLSVGGSFQAVAVPEPSSFAFFALLLATGNLRNPTRDRRSR